MPRKEYIAENECPWWSEKVALDRFIKLASSCNREDLGLHNRLDLSSWALQDQDIITIVNASNRYIKQLTFRGCAQLTDGGIYMLAANWNTRGMMDGFDARLQDHFNQNLTRLDLSGCSQLTDASCGSIANCPRLLGLNFKDRR
jgi:hypothetical protein